MSQPIVRVEGLGKKYFIDNNKQERYVALRDVLSAKANQFKRQLLGQSVESYFGKQEFWALKDVSFEIKQGDRVGIVGPNGAGKSTLLKLLSRITKPTLGSIEVRGRVASLLEVGTGFHPELTGKENIYLNGAILGMGKSEINRKFDEIVAFAEVETFLDTPVKRYSSGMYVRLAFSIAAHLEPEILIIDEILAVGDARFQKKCLGRMEEIGDEGRTVIYVSHQLSTVASLCTQAILFVDGKICSLGTPSKVIFDYLTDQSQSSFSYLNFGKSSPSLGDEQVELLEAFLTNSKGEIKSEFEIDEPIEVHMNYMVIDENIRALPNFHFYRNDGICAFVTSETRCLEQSRGQYTATCSIPKNFLNDGMYLVGLALTSFDNGEKIHFFQKDAIAFHIRDSMEGTVGRSSWSGVIPGAVRPEMVWNLIKNE